MVGFAGGYVVLSEKGVFWSADGEAWTAVTVPSDVSSIATDGRTVVLAGSEERDCTGDRYQHQDLTHSGRQAEAGRHARVSCCQFVGHIQLTCK